jgi:hypothetical protein
MFDGNDYKLEAFPDLSTAAAGSATTIDKIIKFTQRPCPCILIKAKTGIGNNP